MEDKKDSNPEDFTRFLFDEDEVRLPIESQLQEERSRSNFLINRLNSVSSAVFLIDVLFVITILTIIGFSEYDVMIMPLLVCVNLLLSVFGVSVWMLGRYLRRAANRFWARNVDAEQIKPEITVQSYMLPLPPEVKLREFRSPAINRVRMGLKQGIAGFGLLTLSLTIIVVFELHKQIPQSEVSMGTDISVFTGILSALLGPLFGVLTIGSISLISTAEGMLMLTSIVIIPSLYFAPAAMNFLIASENLCREAAFSIGLVLPGDRSFPLLGTIIFAILPTVITAYAIHTLVS
jgi:hypothetical protein